MQIPAFELNEWLEELPSYQSEIIKQLVAQYGEEDAIDKWLTASGPTNTVKFGGTGENSVADFPTKFKNEINKFICGHPDYSNERADFAKLGDKTKAAIVSSLSALIGSQLGVAATVLSPVVVLSLFLAGKMGVKAYCSGITYD